MNVTSQYYPLNSENINRYPYVDRISCKVGEEDEIDFIYQYVKISYVFYSQPNECFNDVDTNIYDKCYNYNDKCYNNKYICGKPTKFPNYGKFPEIFTMVCESFLILSVIAVENIRNLILDFRFARKCNKF